MKAKSVKGQKAKIANAGKSKSNIDLILEKSEQLLNSSKPISKKAAEDMVSELISNLEPMTEIDKRAKVKKTKSANSIDMGKTIMNAIKNEQKKNQVSRDRDSDEIKDLLDYAKLGGKSKTKSPDIKKSERLRDLKSKQSKHRKSLAIDDDFTPSKLTPEEAQVLWDAKWLAAGGQLDNKNEKPKKVSIFKKLKSALSESKVLNTPTIEQVMTTKQIQEERNLQSQQTVRADTTPTPAQQNTNAFLDNSGNEIKGESGGSTKVDKPNSVKRILRDILKTNKEMSTHVDDVKWILNDIRENGGMGGGSGSGKADAALAGAAGVGLGKGRWLKNISKFLGSALKSPTVLGIIGTAGAMAGGVAYINKDMKDKTKEAMLGDTSGMSPDREKDMKSFVDALGEKVTEDTFTEGGVNGKNMSFWDLMGAGSGGGNMGIPIGAPTQQKFISDRLRNSSEFKSFENAIGLKGTQITSNVRAGDLKSDHKLGGAIDVSTRRNTRDELSGEVVDDAIKSGLFDSSKLTQLEYDDNTSEARKKAWNAYVDLKKKENPDLYKNLGYATQAKGKGGVAGSGVEHLHMGIQDKFAISPSDLSPLALNGGNKDLRHDPTLGGIFWGSKQQSESKVKDAIGMLDKPTLKKFLPDGMTDSLKSEMEKAKSINSELKRVNDEKSIKIEDEWEKRLKESEERVKATQPKSVSQSAPPIINNSTVNNNQLNVSNGNSSFANLTMPNGTSFNAYGNLV